jgi:hypothetical protein
MQVSRKNMILSKSFVRFLNVKNPWWANIHEWSGLVMETTTHLSSIRGLLLASARTKLRWFSGNMDHSMKHRQRSKLYSSSNLWKKCSKFCDLMHTVLNTIPVSTLYMSLDTIPRRLGQLVF